MFNLLMTLVIGVIIGWNFHSFFMQLTPPVLSKSALNVSDTADVTEEKCVKTSTKIFKIKSKEITPKTMPLIVKKEENIIMPVKIKDTFYDYLEHDLFSDAMSLYVDASKPMLLLYQSTLIEYFEKNMKNKPQETFEKMMEFQEIEAEERKVNIDTLNQLDDDLEEKVKLLLQLIKSKLNKKANYDKAGYDYEVPLNKLGEHFTLNALVNEVPVTLLLDTGASLSMLNSTKVSSLKLINEHITLNTAGGEVDAELREAQSFTVGAIKLENFQIVSSNFEQKQSDGLLGMNFFKKFKFKIDQEKALLYLSPKEI